MDEYEFRVSSVPQSFAAEVWVRLHRAGSIDAAQGWVDRELGAEVEVRWETPFSGVVVVRQAEERAGWRR